MFLYVMYVCGVWEVFMSVEYLTPYILLPFHNALTQGWAY
jgi:hypothetical protein